jgi:hypothetical protein
VGHYEAIRNILKSWIPHITILAPEDFKRDLLKDMKDWGPQAEGVTGRDGRISCALAGAIQTGAGCAENMKKYYR